MTDRPILFSAPMVRALLDGRKTQTRRVISTKPSRTKINLFDGTWSDSYVLDPGNQEWREQAYPWRVGDRLWVRETWRPVPVLNPWDMEVIYNADGEHRIISDGEFGDSDWSMPKAAKSGNVSPLFMPRWASRLTLIVTDVRVQRLQEISEEDAIAEGIEDVTAEVASGDRSLRFWKRYRDGGWNGYVDNPIGSYASLWTEINGPGSWEADPWVVALTFQVKKANIGSLPEPQQ